MTKNVPSDASPSVSKHRNDIDGLRAVSILLVVIYHVWIGRVSGGVDAFLIISAFFLTTSFVGRLERKDPIAIRAQLVRTFKRLLPPAALVLMLTLFAGLIIFPENRFHELFRQVWGSLFYVENWLLAAESTDYYADNSGASPFQHFWSLSVQGQVYLLFPFLFLLVRYFSEKSGRTIQTVAIYIFSGVFALSFVYSVWTTITRQEFAYFDTWARLWEFAAGALLALCLPYIEVSSRLRHLLGWLGLAGLLLCGIIVDVQGGFPGYLALWPVLSVTAVIISGVGDNSPGTITRLLGSRPLVAIGHDAYALYLVHWPILIFALTLNRGNALTFVEGLFVIVLSIALARLITWGVDDLGRPRC